LEYGTQDWKRVEYSFLVGAAAAGSLWDALIQNAVAAFKHISDINEAATSGDELVCTP
jgi:lipoprotein signal peptidase